MDIKTMIDQKGQGRYMQPATSLDDELGDLMFLPGTWQNSDRFQDRGWNMIALPFSDPIAGGTDPRDYRVLANQYNETLFLKTADKGVPNRGVLKPSDTNLDQTLIALDYEQAIKQVKAADSPPSGLAGDPQKPIHHEPGLWLHMLNHHKPGANIARLGTIPHGNSLLALGTAEPIDATNIENLIPEVNPFPVLTGISQVPLDDPLERYLQPYAEFVEPTNTFFPSGLDLRNLHGLLQASTPANILRGMKYSVSTGVETGGIVNTPFIVDRADATEMHSTFWIFELEELDQFGKPAMVMQYMQFIMLDFFDKFDGSGEKIRWPHISLNTMIRTSDDYSYGEEQIRSMMSDI